MLHAQKIDTTIVTVVISPTVAESPDPPVSVALRDGAEWLQVPTGTVSGATFDGSDWVSPNSRTLTRLGYLQRFSAQERIAIKTAAATDPVVADLLELLSATQEVRLDSAATRQGLGYLVQQEIITDARRQEILA